MQTRSGKGHLFPMAGLKILMGVTLALTLAMAITANATASRPKLVATTCMGTHYLGIQVPRVIGMSFAQAAERLEIEGFVPAGISLLRLDSTSGMVLQQHPSPGCPGPHGSVVELTTG